jgi:hypothetical protein
VRTSALDRGAHVSHRTEASLDEVVTDCHIDPVIRETSHVQLRRGRAVAVAYRRFRAALIKP